METSFKKVKEIYDQHESHTAAFREAAACEKGCAFCCTDAGSIDMTTLEGLLIRSRIEKLPRPQQKALYKALAKDARRREKGESSPCPFLLKNMACGIYDVRPFSCRRIYSLKKCGPQQSPMLHRQVMALAKDAIRSLQQIDGNGYSGHLSYIMHMLDTRAFLSTYLAGEFQPEAIMVYGKTHRIVINRMMTG
jgi:Fe-S-cluster containining protein